MPVHRVATIAMVCVYVVSLLGLTGCQSAHVAELLTANSEQVGNEPEAQMEFWHTLATRPMTSNDEAFHALLLFLDDGDVAENYEQRVDRLKNYGLLSARFNRPANEAITRGVLAVALVQVLDIQGGVMLSVFDHSQRYATLELQHMGIYPRSSPHQTFTGNQFISMIGAAEDHQTRGGQRASQRAILEQSREYHATPLVDESTSSEPADREPADREPVDSGEPTELMEK